MSNILYLTNTMKKGGGVQVCIMQLCDYMKSQSKVFVASEGGEYVNKLDKIGIKHYRLSNIENKDFKNIVSNLFILLKIIKEQNIDIIHSHHRMTTLYAKIISKIYPVKIIHTQHLCIEDKYFLTKIALSNIPIITVSESAKKILINKSHLDESLITTIYNTVYIKDSLKSVDDRFIKMRDKYKMLICHVSRLVDYKGVYDLIEIIKIVDSLDLSIGFIIMGDGPEKSNILNFIEYNSLSDRVVVLGNVDNVLSYLTYIDLLLLCSYVEGLPLAPLEAFYSGVPVIATDIPGTNEEIINGYNGFLVKPKDVEGFVKKIVQCYNDDNLIKKLGYNAEVLFQEKFSYELYTYQHIEKYTELVK